MANQTIPQDILKIQKKLATFEKDSRNYKKYTKILAKHIKQHIMKKRVASHIKTIENVQQMQESSTQNEENEK
jgi:hypothetical protein